MVGAAFVVYIMQPHFEELHMERMNNSWGIALIVVGTALLIFKICFLLYILSLYLRYRSIKSVSDDRLPVSTVIVPAYNEGELVYQTLMSLAQSDYPHEKLQLISIDDGSKDDT